MRKFLAHTDLTNPEAYHNMINRNTVLVERPYDKTYCGVIHKTVEGFEVEFSEKGKYFVVDSYRNSRYLSNWNNRAKMFELIRSNDFQLCDDIEEIDTLIRKFFKRKVY